MIEKKTQALVQRMRAFLQSCSEWQSTPRLGRACGDAQSHLQGRAIPTATNQTRVRDTLCQERSVGPILFCRDWHDGRLQLACLLAILEGAPTPVLSADGKRIEGEHLHSRVGYRLVRYEFSLGLDAATGYRLDECWYPVNARWDHDLRLAFVACNGQEHDDRNRLVDERNALWQRLVEQHSRAPLQLLLHGGDQLYADEMLQIHPAVRAWAKHDRHYDGSTAALPELREKLQNYLFERYLELYSQSGVAWLMARVPSLAIWDDHDICDGWGSRPAAQLDSPVGQVVFQVAREQFLLFQMAAAPENLPAMCPDRRGDTLSWRVQFPGLRILAPDLRSERRPDRVMGERGWSVLRSMLSKPENEQVLVLSSVPALGPRLSWVESILMLLPQAQKYEDDLRDQWQSRAHRREWRAFLRALLEARNSKGTRLSVLSGEIHLATRGTIDAASGHLHQLVSSGIAHPPPPWVYARALGALARLGGSPLRGHPIRLLPLPGRRETYTAQRNYLVLERRSGRWCAWWELEHDGATPALSLD